MVAVVVGCAVLAAGASAAAAQDGADRPERPLTALEVRGVRPPQVVKGTDGRKHIEYDLVITNVFTGEFTIDSIEVRDGAGRRLLLLEGEALAAVTTKILGTDPTATVPPSTTVQTVVDVVLPAGASVPARLTHRVRYTLAPNAPFFRLIGSSEVSVPTLTVERRKPIVVAPPLRGPGWIALNACCQPSSHRSFILSADGGLVTPEVFAIDWIREQGGSVIQGDGSQNSQWFGHGTPIFAAAGGTVVAVVNDMPEVPPGAGADDNPTLTNTSSFGGNHVLVRMRPGVFALYGHLITGSARVEVGDRVATGQQLGLLGNSGNTAAPHLHFGLIDGPGVLSSDSLPFVIDRFTFSGIATLEEGGPVSISGTPRPVVRAHPLTNSVADFGP